MKADWIVPHRAHVADVVSIVEINLLHGSAALASAVCPVSSILAIVAAVHAAILFAATQLGEDFDEPSGADLASHISEPDS